jgi:hypothetical protein
MTRLEIRIDELVLRDIPPALARSLPQLVEASLAALASGRAAPGSVGPGGPVADQDALAGLVADRVWEQVARSTGHLGLGATRPTEQQAGRRHDHPDAAGTG